MAIQKPFSSISFIKSFNADEFERESLNPLTEANRVLALGPKRGPDDTVQTRLVFLREMDARAVKH